MRTEVETPKPPLLEVRGIRKTFVSRGIFTTARRVVAAEGVSFRLDRGQALALVGESGSGKSTVARILVRLENPDGGEILLDGTDVLSREPRKASVGYRARVQMVFQDPFGSLNPVHTVGHHLVRPLLRHRRVPASGARDRAIELLRTVELEPAEEFIDRRPDELSGGQRQRVAIARALAVDPDLLVADEPTSMLDVSIRMGLLNLLLRLKRERRLAILLITHDLASARYLSDRILVLFRGRVVEDGPADSVVETPAHPYTQALLASIADGPSTEAPPTGTPAEKLLAEVPAEAGSSGVRAGVSRAKGSGRETEGGCPFAHRCSRVFDVCRSNDPAPRRVGDRVVRCHLYPEDAREPGR